MYYFFQILNNTPPVKNKINNNPIALLVKLLSSIKVLRDIAEWSLGSISKIFLIYNKALNEFPSLK